MMDQRTLEKMSREAAAGAGVDLLGMTIAGDTPVQRLESYLEQVDNPYCVRVEQTSVKLLFHNEERSLPEKLRSYFLSLKNSDISDKMRFDRHDYRGEMKGDP